MRTRRDKVKKTEKVIRSGSRFVIRNAVAYSLYNASEDVTAYIGYGSIAYKPIPPDTSSEDGVANVIYNEEVIVEFKDADGNESSNGHLIVEQTVLVNIEDIQRD